MVDSLHYRLHPHSTTTFLFAALVGFVAMVAVIFDVERVVASIWEVNCIVLAAYEDRSARAGREYALLGLWRSQWTYLLAPSLFMKH